MCPTTKTKPKTTKAKASKTTAATQQVTIAPPNLKVVAVQIRGDAPYVQHAFSAKARLKMKAAQEAGSAGKNRSKKEPRDFMADYEAAMHKSTDGWPGIPAPAFRNALISACRVAGYVMTKAKLSLFVLGDGFDAGDGQPLVKITKGRPEYHESTVRLDNGTADIRARPMWKPGWEATVRIRFDADQFTASDVLNLLARVGMQVGVGEGRPDSKKSTGMGWGTFEIVTDKDD